MGDGRCVVDASHSLPVVPFLRLLLVYITSPKHLLAKVITNIYLERMARQLEGNTGKRAEWGTVQPEGDG